MRTTIRHSDSLSIIEPCRNLIGESVPELRQLLTKEIDRCDEPRILIDFCRVRCMDSGGLGTLVNASCLAQSKRGHIGVMHVGKNIKNLIVRSRLINFFEHFENETAAESAWCGVS